jgi:predicted nucleotidyltransferase
MNILCEMNYGSVLYGTNTKDSDIDIKGIFMPSLSQIFLGKIPKNITEKSNKSNSKNTKDDIEKDYYSLHYFIELACSGQTVALDMLNCNKKNLLRTSAIWEDLVKNKDRFYSKNMKAFIGYARSQAAKYGAKGDRLSSAKELRDFLWLRAKDDKLTCIWGDIEKLNLPHLHFKKGTIRAGGESVNELVICGKTIQETATVLYAIGILNHFLDRYGKRAKLAAKNEGVDWKAVSHSIRIASELKEIYEYGKITFPLKNANWLVRVKKEELDYMTEVSPVMDDLMDEIEELSRKSKFPEKVDRYYWEGWLIEIMTEQILNSFNELLSKERKQKLTRVPI